MDLLANVPVSAIEVVVPPFDLDIRDRDYREPERAERPTRIVVRCTCLDPIHDHTPQVIELDRAQEQTETE